MSAVRRRLAERARGAVREVRRQTSTRAAKVARRRGIEILGSKISGLSLLQQRFDVVCAVDVIEHAPDPAEFARELLRPLNPGRPAAVDRRDRHGRVGSRRRRLLVLQHRRPHQLYLDEMGPATCARAATDAVRGRPLPVRGSRRDETRRRAASLAWSWRRRISNVCWRCFPGTATGTGSTRTASVASARLPTTSSLASCVPIPAPSRRRPLEQRETQSSVPSGAPDDNARTRLS